MPNAESTTVKLNVKLFLAELELKKKYSVVLKI